MYTLFGLKLQVKYHISNTSDCFDAFMIAWTVITSYMRCFSPFYLPSYLRIKYATYTQYLLLTLAYEHFIVQ